MKRNAARILCFIFIAGLCCCYANRVLSMKNIDGISNFYKFYHLRDNTVDVLTLGSSHAFQNVNTGTLWDDYGIAGFDLGSESQPIWTTYYFLKEALKTQKPKLVIIEAYSMFGGDYGTDSMILKGIAGMKWSADKIEAIRVSAPKGRRAGFALGLPQYHKRYAELAQEDFFDEKRGTLYSRKGTICYENWKGFFCNMETKPMEKPDVNHVSERRKLSEKREEWYRKTIKLAQENEVPILVIAAPYPAVSQSIQAQYNTIGDIAAEYGVDFVNYNLLHEELGLDYSKDIADEHHLNYNGSRKFSHALGKYIKERWDIPDRRGDKSYRTWEEDARAIASLIKNRAVTEAADLSDVIRAISNQEYQLFVSLDGNARASDERFFPFLSRLGISKKEGAGIWYVDSTGKRIWYSGMKEAEAYFEVDGCDVYCSRSFDEAAKAYANSVFFDGNAYKKVTNGLNVVVYNPLTKQVIDSFGCNGEEGNKIIR